MDWIAMYTADTRPTEGQIAEFIQSPLWAELNDFLRTGYETEPKYSYSACSAQPGWNVKYQKAGKSLCTLYPMEGFFIALVVIGAREHMEAELLLPTLTPHVQALFAAADSTTGARWLMIDVTDRAILADVKRLIELRRRVKR